MTGEEAKELQQNIESFFKDVSDGYFILIVDRFVYHNENSIEKVNKLFNEFLKENSLTKHFEDYEFDMSDKAGYFRKCRYSAAITIENLKSCFLSASHNRFRKATSKLIKDSPHGKHT